MKTNKKSKKMRGVMSAAALLLALTLPPAAHGQSDGFFNNAGPNDNFNGGGSWGNFNNADPGDNFGGGGLWGNFNNVGPDDNTGGGGSWGNFNNTSPDASLGGGLALLTVAGFGYACAKRRKAKKQELR